MVARDPGRSKAQRIAPQSTTFASYLEAWLLIDCTHLHHCVWLGLSAGRLGSMWVMNIHT